MEGLLIESGTPGFEETGGRDPFILILEKFREKFSMAVALCLHCASSDTPLTFKEKWGIMFGMDDKRIKKRRGELSARQQAYVNNRAKGIPRQESAIMAGYSEADKSGKSVEMSPVVKNALAAAREEAIKNTGVTKEQVVAMLTEAADMAKTLSDPQGLIAAARELGKMLGFYAPEVKKTLHGVDQVELKKALEAMTEEELLRMANSKMKVIDGTCERLS